MARKNTIATEQPAQTVAKAAPRSIEPLNIGLDIGYGVVKAVTPNRVKPVVFPSVAGHSRVIKFAAEQIAEKYPGCHIIDKHGDWFVGDLAASQVPTGELLRLRGRGANDNSSGNAFRLRMALAAIGMILSGCYWGDECIVPVNITTGLPVDHLHNRAELKQALMGTHRIRTDSADVTVNIQSVRIMPQPYGTVYRKMMLSNGRLNPQHTAMRTGVCDVGTYTIDVAMDDDGEFIDAESGSVEAGVFTVQERIGAQLERDFNQKMPYKKIEETLRTGYCKAFGENLDYRDLVDEALAPLRYATLGLLNDKFKAGAGVDVLYLSGGGAELVFNDVMRAYPQTIKVDDPQLANAQGYLNFELFKQLEAQEG